MEAENGGKINPRFWTQKSHWKGKTRRFFGEFNNFEILTSWFHRVTNSISSKCALSPWYPHFCAGGAGDCEECSTSGLDRHNASLEISFLCINYPPSFHSIVATHTFLRVKSDVNVLLWVSGNSPKMTWFQVDNTNLLISLIWFACWFEVQMFQPCREDPLKRPKLIDQTNCRTLFFCFDVFCWYSHVCSCFFTISMRCS